MNNNLKQFKKSVQEVLSVLWYPIVCNNYQLALQWLNTINQHRV